MADAAVASGLLPYQKDEHDIWICKSCGWKYPNAKPSPKIRNNHKKNCPGKVVTQVHNAGGSSDDVSDDGLQGSMAPKEITVDAADPQLEMKLKDFDVASFEKNVNMEAARAAAPLNGNGAAAAAAPLLGNGIAKAAPARKEDLGPGAAPVSPGGLMPHQKDEHDIWTCKECGWKYPNARPSPKIRKNHKKHCPGNKGPTAPGGSSDEASDDEHHHAPAALAVDAESGPKESGSVATVPAEVPTSVSRGMGLAALEESRNSEVPESTSTIDTSLGGNWTTASSPTRLNTSVPEARPAEMVPAAMPVNRNLAAPREDRKDSSTPEAKIKSPVSNPVKTSPGVPGGKKAPPPITAKPPWRY